MRLGDLCQKALLAKVSALAKTLAVAQKFELD